MTKLYIKDTKTGEIHLSKWQDTDSYSWWVYGNMSCDCNRAIAFGREDRGEHNCGDGRYDLVNEDGSPFTDWPVDDDS